MSSFTSRMNRGSWSCWDGAAATTGSSGRHGQPEDLTHRDRFAALADAAAAATCKPAGLAEWKRQSASCRCGASVPESGRRDALAESGVVFGNSTPTTVTGESGVKMTGPYDYVAPSYWYVDQHNGGAFGFNTETSPGPGDTFAGEPREIPARSAGVADRRLTGACITAAEGFANLNVFNEAMGAVYAKPHSAAQYERVAQTMEYDSERAMYEAYSKNKYFSTGVIQWMLNNAWPSMIWHLYDYYLDAGAGYFANQESMRAAARPILDTTTGLSLSSTARISPCRDFAASVHVHNLAWKQLYSAEAKLNAASDSSQRGYDDSRRACIPAPRGSS